MQAGIKLPSRAEQTQRPHLLVPPPEGEQPNFRRALMIFEEVYGPDRPRVAETLNNLARLKEDTFAFEEAAQLYCQAVHKLLRVYGSDHPTVIRVQANLMRCQAKLSSDN